MGKHILPPALRGHFAAFWAAYPPHRPNPRALAEAAFGRAVAAGATPEDLIRAATAYAAECRARGIAQDFVVHARTFLVQRRWLDYLAAPGSDPAPAPAAPSIDHPLWGVLEPFMLASDFRAWILPLAIIRHETDGTLHLLAPSRFHARHVETQFGALICRAAGAPELRIEP